MADTSRRATKILQPIYQAPLGAMYAGDSKKLLKRAAIRRHEGQVQLILTSPPFPLNRKKRYDNLQGREYLRWLQGFAKLFGKYLAPNGSIAVEIGNVWNPNSPTMSTLSLEALLAFLEAGKFKLCQEFICFNPAHLPTPAQWVNIERIRVKDAFTRVSWMSSTDHPKADNRNVLTQYSKSMRDLLKKGTYSADSRPSEHHIGQSSFLNDNGGAIPPNVIVPGPELSEQMFFDADGPCEDRTSSCCAEKFTAIDRWLMATKDVSKGKSC